MKLSFKSVTWAFAISVLCLSLKSGIQAQGLLPDLQTVIPLHLQIQNAHQREILRFSNGIANTGIGDLRLRPEFPDVNSELPHLGRHKSSIIGIYRRTAYKAFQSQ